MSKAFEWFEYPRNHNKTTTTDHGHFKPTRPQTTDWQSIKASEARGNSVLYKRTTFSALRNRIQRKHHGQPSTIKEARGKSQFFGTKWWSFFVHFGWKMAIKNPRNSTSYHFLGLMCFSAKCYLEPSLFSILVILHIPRLKFFLAVSATRKMAYLDNEANFINSVSWWCPLSHTEHLGQKHWIPPPLLP